MFARSGRRTRGRGIYTNLHIVNAILYDLCDSGVVFDSEVVRQPMVVGAVVAVFVAVISAEGKSVDDDHGVHIGGVFGEEVDTSPLFDDDLIKVEELSFSIERHSRIFPKWVRPTRHGFTMWGFGGGRHKYRDYWCLSPAPFCS